MVPVRRLNKNNLTVKLNFCTVYDIRVRSIVVLPQEVVVECFVTAYVQIPQKAGHVDYKFAN